MTRCSSLALILAPILALGAACDPGPAGQNTPADAGGHDASALADAAPGDDGGTPVTQDCGDDSSGWTVGRLGLEAGSEPGYILFSPITSTTTYLIDQCGRLIRHWTSDVQPGQSVTLLPNGHLLRTESLYTQQNSPFPAGGQGGRIRELDWDGALVWEYSYAATEHLQHHDLEPLPSGNVLMIAWQLKSQAEAIAAGRDPATLTESELWPDSVIELQPDGQGGASIVWEWHVWDHLVQDYDAARPDFGVVAEHPERIDLNYARQGKADWTHVNSVAYHAELDQIVLSVHGFGEVWIIDHSTSTGEAASSSGGLRGRGGDLLYRWGNPLVYGAGGPTDQRLFGQHDARWIPTGSVGEDHLLIFNNGQNRTGGSYSSVDELDTGVGSDGLYPLASGSAWGPADLSWTYVAGTPTDFYADHISGAHRLPGGNTLICSGIEGLLFEVTASGEIVWEYLNPVTKNGRATQGEPLPTGPGGANEVFRATHYSPDYAAFAGRTLTPGDYLELPASP